MCVPCTRVCVARQNHVCDIVCQAGAKRRKAARRNARDDEEEREKRLIASEAEAKVADPPLVVRPAFARFSFVSPLVRGIIVHECQVIQSAGYISTSFAASVLHVSLVRPLLICFPPVPSAGDPYRGISMYVTCLHRRLRRRCHGISARRHRRFARRMFFTWLDEIVPWDIHCVALLTLDTVSDHTLDSERSSRKSARWEKWVIHRCDTDSIM